MKVYSFQPFLFTKGGFCWAPLQHPGPAHTDSGLLLRRRHLGFLAPVECTVTAVVERRWWVCLIHCSENSHGTQINDVVEKLPFVHPPTNPPTPPSTPPPTRSTAFQHQCQNKTKKRKAYPPNSGPSPRAHRPGVTTRQQAARLCYTRQVCTWMFRVDTSSNLRIRTMKWGGGGFWGETSAGEGQWLTVCRYHKKRGGGVQLLCNCNVTHSSQWVRGLLRGFVFQPTIATV